jgi:hypothetical protein
MFVNLKCPYCGMAQQVPAGPMPTIAACAQCGSALDVPGAMPSQQARYPAQPPRYRAPGYGPRGPYAPQAFYPAPPRQSNTAGLVIGLVVTAGFVALVIVGVVASAIEEASTSVSPCAPIGDYCAPSTSEILPAPNPGKREYEVVEYTWGTSDFGQYSIEFTGKPQDSVSTMRHEGGKLALHRKVFNTGQSRWEVCFCDLPQTPDSVEAVLEGETALLNEHNGSKPTIDRAVETEALNGDKFPGRELHYRSPGGELRCYRIFLVHNRLFFVNAAIRDEKKIHAVDRFFFSFHLVGELPKEGWPARFLPEEPKPDRGTAVPEKK